MTRMRRKRTPKADKRFSRALKTKRRIKDLDQVVENLKPENVEKLLNREPDPELPGLGLHMCVECDRYLESEHALTEHRRGKEHKKRVKLLKEKPYSQEEAEAAVGLRTNNRQPTATASAAATAATSDAMDTSA
ncbi:hypothetical protein GQ42DRAFT_87653 [Ramicandelaber brevisporus]|nr:hypothetical protein GQ42DRAFT_87653 [Ramicandelaber brevisporus]